VSLALPRARAWQVAHASPAPAPSCAARRTGRRRQRARRSKLLGQARADAWPAGRYRALCWRTQFARAHVVCFPPLALCVRLLPTEPVPAGPAEAIPPRQGGCACLLMRPPVRPLPLSHSCAASRTGHGQHSLSSLGHAGGRHRAPAATFLHMSAASAGEAVQGEATAEEADAAELALRDLPAAATECWRPTTDDVDRISWGKPAKKKMTGSRGVPHRLNEEERILYDMARRKGFVEIGGSGWRKQRRGAPLVNSYRNWCDARAVPVVYLYKGNQGIDEVQLDLSPLRIPDEFHALAIKCADAASGAVVEAFEDEGVAIAEGEDGTQQELLGGGGTASAAAPQDSQLPADIKEAYITEPIHRVPMYSVCWSLERPEAKDLCKRLAEAFQCMETGAKAGGASLKRGMPNVKAGKSRQVK